jgi:hypothetical protein
VTYMESNLVKNGQYSYIRAMNFEKLQALSFSALLIMAPMAHTAGTPVMYRYHNDQGNMVVDFQVPNAHSAKGYEILNTDGIVIEVVPRELTAEEQKMVSARDKLLAEAVAEQERLRHWDESLLLRYSTIEDIEASRKRALSSLLINVSILKSNTRSLKQQVENYQAHAADIERRGGEVDLQRLGAIEDLQGEIQATERSIADRRQEMGEVEADYQMDIDRFEQLLDVVALRRSLLANESR